MTSMIVLLFFAKCIAGNYATTFNKPNLLMDMMSRLEVLERKSEKYDILLQENEMQKQLISELTLRVQNLEQCGECKNKEEIHNLRVLSSRANESQHSGKYVGKKNLLQSMQMSKANPNKKHKDTGMLENHIKTRRVVSDAPDQIAFYAYMYTNSESNLPVRHILRFDTVIVNEGQGYHQDDGVFTVPRNGKYIFSWTIAAETGGFVSVEIVVDGRVVGSSFANGPYGWDFSTGVVIVQASAGNHVFIRMHQTGSGVVHSDAKGRSSFSGYLLF